MELATVYGVKTLLDHHIPGYWISKGGGPTKQHKNQRMNIEGFDIECRPDMWYARHISKANPSLGPFRSWTGTYIAARKAVLTRT